MKFTLSWLRQHLDTAAPLDRIAETLTMIGLEVEEILDRSKELAPFKVASVKEARQHPDADRLRVCIVDTGEEEVQVVCGAPNARTGMKGVFAPAGSYIPGTGMVLKPGKIRGQESNGMLVSEREMGISDEHDGIIDMPEDAPVGTPFAVLMGLDDPVIEIGITPNRGDCLGVRGVARDLAAAGLGTLKPLEAPAVPGSFDSPVLWKRALPADAQGACPYVAGRYFRNVTNGPSPKWLQDRLLAIGLRPISALVDITNFVTFDLGRPLHVFDADKLAGHPTMRMAGDGEEILALDGKSYSLDGEMVVIGDGAAAQGIGGVMGGALSGVGETTENVFLEVALFDPVRVAATGRKLGIHSDARYRFERGLDPQSAIWGCEVAARLIQTLCGGEVSHVVDAGTLPDRPRNIDLRVGRVRALGGIAIAADEQQRILTDLGFAVTAAGGGETGVLSCQVPSWRRDVECEACLVEEVIRIHGYDRLVQEPLTLDRVLPAPALSPGQRRASAARTALAWRGLSEAVTFSFMSSETAALFGELRDDLALINPISSDLDVMRPSVLPNLIVAAARNIDRGTGDVALYEVGPAYRDDQPDGQVSMVSAVRVGQARGRHWSDAARDVDVFDAKADALAVLTACEAPVENLQVTTDAAGHYHPGRSGVLRLGPKVLAQFGELHPKVLRKLGLKAEAAGFELFLDAIPEPKAKAKASGKRKPALALSALQPVERDFAFVVDRAVPAEKLIRAAKGADKRLVAAVSLFDAYAGPGLEDGTKSLAIAVTLQPLERTMTDDEIEAVSARIVAQVEKATGGRLRT